MDFLVWLQEVPLESLEMLELEPLESRPSEVASGSGTNPVKMVVAVTIPSLERPVPPKPPTNSMLECSLC